MIIGAIENFQGLTSRFAIPEGLEFVAGSGTVPDGLKDKLGCDDTDWTEMSKVYLIDGLGVYTSSDPTVVFTFKCKVKEGATGTQEVKFDTSNPDTTLALADDDFEEYETIIKTTPVTVTAAPKPAESISVKTETTLTVGNKETLIATVIPSDCTDEVTWTSDNTDVATVDSTGTVEGKSVGTAKITAKAGDKTAECTVTVKAAPCTHASKKPVAAKESDCQNKGWDAYKVCENCGVYFDMHDEPIADIPYLALGSHRFTSKEKSQAALKTAGNCKDEAVYWYSCEVCHNVERDDSHTFKGEKDPNNHVGGTKIVGAAEPDHVHGIDGFTGDKVCVGCEVTLEEGSVISAGDHVPATVWNSDENFHWKKCDVTGCGVVIDGTKAAHVSTGENKATCQHRAKCDICNTEYGTKAGHVYSTEWSKDGSTHWHACNECGDKHDEAAHVYDRETTEYKASDATCTAKATYYKTCVCGAKGTETFEYGDVNGHTEGDEWLYNEREHWHICKVTGCGVVIEESRAPHRPDREKATVDNEVKCLDCGYVLQEKINIVTVEIPFTVTVKKGGNVAPGKQTFELEIFNIHHGNENLYADVTYTATVETDGEKDYNATIKITGPADQVYNMTCEDFFVRQKNTKAANWTYSDAVWCVRPLIEDEGNVQYTFYPTHLIDDGNDYEADRESQDKMTFVNTYTENKSAEKPGSAEDTGDSSMLIWVALLLVSGGVAVGMTVYSRKRKNAR